jgi:FkbM family methyltransferase
MYLNVWRRFNSRAGNVHLDKHAARLKKVPFTNVKVFLRPTESDVARVSEFLGSIYFNDSYLHAALKQTAPQVLIDIGANIGLSSLSLLREFPSIRKVIGVEAEQKNFEILKQNYELWSGIYPHINFQCIHGVATSSGDDLITQLDSLSEMTGKNSASGTFRFDAKGATEFEAASGTLKAISVSGLFNTIARRSGVVVKIDIEGGEEYLLSKNVDWIELCSFITIEIHDRYHETMINSSRGIMKVLATGDFAISPEKDVLHCFNRNLIGSELTRQGV